MCVQWVARLGADAIAAVAPPPPPHHPHVQPTPATAFGGISLAFYDMLVVADLSVNQENVREGRKGKEADGRAKAREGEPGPF